MYSGSRYQVGGGILSDIYKKAMPIIKSAAKVALRRGASAAVKHIPKVLLQSANKNIGMKKALINATMAVGKESGRATINELMPVYRNAIKRRRRKKKSAPIPQSGGGRRRKRGVIKRKNKIVRRKKRDIFG